MPIFKRKEKNLIPEVNPGPGPAGGGGSGAGGGGNYNSYSSNPVNTGDGRGKKEKPDPEGFEKLPGRTYQRERYNYQPTSSSSRATQPGGYGNYGNYGQPQQPPPIEGGQGLGQGGYSGASSNPGGYGGYSNNARNDLFKGARAPAPTTGASFDSYAAGGGRGGSYGGSTGRSAPQSGSLSHGYDEGVLSGGGGNGGEEGREGGEQDQEYTEEDDEVEAIKQQIRFTKQESLSTTRNAIRTAREAEETAQRTLGKLGEQTDRIANTELALDRAKGYNSRAADGAKQIKQLNQSIFKPSFTFNKSGKRDAEEQRILARHLEEKADREEAREAAYASRERVEQGFREAEKSSRSKFGFSRNGNNDAESSSAAPKTGRAKWEQGGRYQFEASNSDDELEAELDDNLDEIAGLTSRLKILATTAGKEIDAQNKHLDKVSGKVDNLDDKILMNTQYLKRIK